MEIIMNTWNNIEERQHINISESTYETLTYDIERFKLSSFSELTNLIIENGLSTLPANPTGYLNEQYNLYSKILKKNMSVKSSKKNMSATDTTIYNNDYTKKSENITSDTKNIIDNILYDITETAKNSFKEKYYKNIKGIQKNIHYSKNAIQLLCASNTAITDIYRRPGKFVCALFDTYAQLKDTERDLIIKKDIYNTIVEAIHQKNIVKIQMYNNNSYYIKPISVHTYINYTYIICKSCNACDSINGEYVDMNPRLSNVISAVNTHNIYEMSDSDIAIIQKKIATNKAAYFYSSSENIQIKLSKTGQKMYETILHQRPSYISSDGDVYTFNCTKRQIYNYFFKFGKEAVILSPQDLKQEFIQKYKESYEIYN